jgi:hypothetical protein
MARNRMVTTGLEDFIVRLHELPDTLRGEAMAIIESNVNWAVDLIKAEYPVLETPPSPWSTSSQPGELVAGVSMEPLTGTVGTAGWKLLSIGKQANWIENGTQVRQTKSGANRGALPPRPTFWPAAERTQERIAIELRDMCTRHGLTVIGI